MAEQVRPWPVRAVPRGTPQDVALSRQVAAVGRVEVRKVLSEQPKAEGQSSGSWAGRAA